MKKLLVIGYGRHGKDTVCEMLCKVDDYAFVSSSEFCAMNVVYPTMLDKYENWEECYNDRHNHRAHWFNTIKAYNDENPSRLATEILKDYDIYCGLRNIEEFEGAKHLFDLIIWVERPGFEPEGSDSMTLTRELADIVIFNDGTLGDLYRKVHNLSKAINKE